MDRPTSDRRAQLLELLATTAIGERSAPVSLRQFAIRAGVAEPTIRHFFTDRQGVVLAILQYFADQAAPFLEQTARPGPSYQASVSGYGRLALEGFDNPLFVKAHAFALVESIHDPVVARAYLDLIIEPSLRAIEHRLAPGLDPGGAAPDTVRHAALCLYSPMLFAALHQTLLRGRDARPLDGPDFFDTLTRLLTRGLAPVSGETR